MPLSPLRIGFNTELLRRHGDWLLSASPDFEATLRLPNIERRLRVFISSNDLHESQRDPALEHNPVRAGVRMGVEALFWGLAKRPSEVGSYCR